MSLRDEPDTPACTCKWESWYECWDGWNLVTVSTIAEKDRRCPAPSTANHDGPTGRRGSAMGGWSQAPVTIRANHPYEEQLRPNARLRNLHSGRHSRP